ncbi:MAG: histidine phosphatase family protein [Candidatus Heimdallarchaeota archaeon]|nr:histidine phosphatase family protein [Candidatus Heimdallarchaeota archaeon]
MNIYLVRHGETDYNKDRLLMGQLDIPLNELGLSQVKKLSKFVENKNISKIYSSDLQRASRTAEIISGTNNIPIELILNFREHTLGRLDGMKWSSEWDELAKDEFEERILREGGESFEVFEERIWGTFVKITEKHSLEDNILIVSHGGCIRMIIMKILEATEEIFSNLSIDNCSITQLIYLPQRKKHKYRILNINSNWFLE